MKGPWRKECSNWLVGFRWQGCVAMGPQRGWASSPVGGDGHLGDAGMAGRGEGSVRARDRSSGRPLSRQHRGPSAVALPHPASFPTMGCLHLLLCPAPGGS